jgi:excisionase family DNA binding protein
MARRPNWRAIKMHWSYTADEAARSLGVAKGTVRRWIKARALPALTDQRPHLILGQDLIAFGDARKRRKLKCAPGELYCVRCRAPRAAAGGMVEFIPLTPLGGNLRAICDVCGTLTHRRISLRQLPVWEALLEVTHREGAPHLRERDRPCGNDYFKGEAGDGTKASS